MVGPIGEECRKCRSEWLYLVVMDSEGVIYCGLRFGEMLGMPVERAQNNRKLTCECSCYVEMMVKRLRRWIEHATMRHIMGNDEGDNMSNGHPKKGSDSEEDRSVKEGEESSSAPVEGPVVFTSKGKDGRGDENAAAKSLCQGNVGKSFTG